MCECVCVFVSYHVCVYGYLYLLADRIITFKKFILALKFAIWQGFEGTAQEYAYLLVHSAWSGNIRLNCLFRPSHIFVSIWLSAMFLSPFFCFISVFRYIFIILHFITVPLRLVFSSFLLTPVFSVWFFTVWAYMIWWWMECHVYLSLWSSIYPCSDKKWHVLWLKLTCHFELRGSQDHTVLPHFWPPIY